MLAQQFVVIIPAAQGGEGGSGEGRGEKVNLAGLVHLTVTDELTELYI